MPVFVICLVLGVAILLAGTPVRADPQAGRLKAQMCVPCHGPLGLATMPNTPNLAGQPEPYLSEQLRAYRNGKRVHDMMTLISKPLTDEEIASLAAWFSSLQVEVKEKP